MAASKKRSSGRRAASSKSKTGARSSGRKKTNTRKNSKNTTKASSLLRNEIKLIVLLATTVLFELSAFGLCGILGDYLSYFLFGMVGLIGYILPAILFAGMTYLILNISEKKAVYKFIFGSIGLLFICAFIQLIFNMDDQTTISDLYFKCAEEKNGGGLLGGLIALGLFSAVGKVGAYFIDIVVIIIMLILLTEKSLFNGVKEGGRKVYERTSEDIERFKESSEERQVEKERLREEKQHEKEKKKRIDNVVKGVPLNVMVDEKDNVNDDMKEITLDDIENPEISDKLEDQLEDNSEKEAEENTGFRFNFAEEDKTKDDKQEIYAEDDMHEIYPDEPEKEPEKISPKDVEEVELDTSVDDSNYKYPPKSLLKKPASGRKGRSNQELSETAAKLQQVLANFGVKVTITDVSMGPSVTRYELQPEMGTKVSKITSLSDDIKLNLAAADIRIEAPIPGKAAVGIEVPNIGREPVLLRELLDAPELKNHPSKLAFASGKDIGGKVVVADIAKMPHMLVAGTTGSGKSVFMNSVIMTILYRAKPSEVRMLIIDPEVVEFGIYNDIPHLLHPVITDPKNAASALNWAVAEMQRRYQLLAENNVRDFQSYNNKVDQMKPEEGEALPEKMPQIIIVIDELADLMMVAAKAVEESICRLAQLARAAGIHLIIATQRPSVDVVTGLIKANVPARVALLVSSGTDSRTIIDMNGAEKLLGNGDMLFYPSGYIKPVRVQGAFVSEEEVANVVGFLKKDLNTSGYDESISEHLTNNNISSGNSSNSSDEKDNERDQYFADAGRLVIEMDKASSSMLQRRFRIGFNRAARIIDELYEQGVIGPEEGSKPRKVVMAAEEFEQLLNEL